MMSSVGSTRSNCINELLCDIHIVIARDADLRDDKERVIFANGAIADTEFASHGGVSIGHYV
jgi:hypothetical protein